jgi:hypothetical protein
MVINTSIPAASLQASPLSNQKTSAQPAATSTDNTSTAQSFSASAEELAAFSQEITSQDGAQQSTDLARNSMLNQSSLALLAQGQHSSQTVLDLLAV